MEYKPKQDGAQDRDRLLNDILNELSDRPSKSASAKSEIPQKPQQKEAIQPTTRSSQPNDSLIDADMEYVFAQRNAVPRQEISRSFGQQRTVNSADAASKKSDAARISSRSVNTAASMRARGAGQSEDRTTAFTAPDYGRTMQTARQPIATGAFSALDQDLEGVSQVSNLSDDNTVGKKKKRRRKHRGLVTLILILLILLVSISASAVMIIYGRDMLGIDSSSTTVIVSIPQGSNTAEIADILNQEGIIDRPNFFVFFAGLGDKDANFKAGDHEVRPDMAYETLISELTSDPLDDSESVTITFPEGITLYDAAVLLEENNVCGEEEFLDYFNNDAKYGYRYEEYLPSLQSDKFYRLEGYFFPDTYTFYQEMNVDLVCQKVMKNFDSKITDVYYDRMEAMDLSLDELITLASMIQAEAGNTEQMKTISSVFWNRLNNPTEYPLLQSDPTTSYVEEVIKPHIDNYNTTIFEAYDTYTSRSLPPGAICNPGIDAIEAALYPESTNYYYFYSNIDTKETFFAETLEQHNANKAKVKRDQEAAAEKEAEEAEKGDDTE